MAQPVSGSVPDFNGAWIVPHPSAQVGGWDGRTVVLEGNSDVDSLARQVFALFGERLRAVEEDARSERAARARNEQVLFEATREIGDLRTRLGATQTELERAIQQGDAQRRVLDAELQQQKARVEIAEREQQVVRQELEDRRQQGRALQEGYRGLVVRLEAAERTCGALQGKNGELAAQAEVDSGRAESAEAEAAKTKAELAEMKQRLEERLQKLMEEWEKYRKEEDSFFRFLDRGLITCAQLLPGTLFDQLLQVVTPELVQDGRKIGVLKEEIGSICQTLGREPPQLRILEAEKLAALPRFSQ